MKVSTTFCNDFSIIRSKQFHQKSVNSKIIIFRSLNAIFGKVGRNTSDEVMLELIRSKTYTNIWTMFGTYKKLFEIIGFCC